MSLITHSEKTKHFINFFSKFSYGHHYIEPEVWFAVKDIKYLLAIALVRVSS